MKINTYLSILKARFEICFWIVFFCEITMNRWTKLTLPINWFFHLKMMFEYLSPYKQSHSKNTIFQENDPEEGETNMLTLKKDTINHLIAISFNFFTYLICHSLNLLLYLCWMIFNLFVCFRRLDIATRRFNSSGGTKQTHHNMCRRPVRRRKGEGVNGNWQVMPL